jgi:Phage tail baseplate hub (GPD)
MTAVAPRFAPDFAVRLNGNAAPAALRASISGVSWQTGLDGSDRVELTLVNENLRWLDHPSLALDGELALSVGYAPDRPEQVFVGEIVGQTASFPSGGGPTLTVVAHDRRHDLQQGTRERWFAIPANCVGQWPMSDVTVASLVSLERALVPIFDPVSAVLSVLFTGAEVAILRNDPGTMQKIIRKQVSESDYDFLGRLARENGWEVLIEHDGALAGRRLRFLSLAEHLSPDVTLRYGQSLADFSPRITNVGQIAGVSARLWIAERKLDFTVTVAWDWDSSSLDISISPGYGTPTSSSKGLETSIMLIEEPLTQFDAARVILAKLLARLNKRLTATGSTVGDPRIRAGRVLRLEGVGAQFGGLYRITSATHTLGSGGYRTQFEVRKEIWFGSIPLAEQGAAHVKFQGQTIPGTGG